MRGRWSGGKLAKCCARKSETRPTASRREPEKLHARAEIAYEDITFPGDIQGAGGMPDLEGSRLCQTWSLVFCLSEVDEDVWVSEEGGVSIDC